MTNAELNLAIAKLVYPDAEYVIKDPQSDKALVRCAEFADTALDFPFTYMLNFDFNNWNDLMPLVVEHGIVFGEGYSEKPEGGYHREGIFEAEHIETTIFASSENPQIALAECLLRVLEAKQ